ncbi:unnamed protein product [Timema podura]|uniref:N-acetylglucosaminylphosphatidylinositol deacetylase n=1 Tax=Timema podura TaxID=61482 RepID=A0ABN7NJC8_TIMPD|nr:unnamed protein product [Timema podura]
MFERFEFHFEEELANLSRSFDGLKNLSSTVVQETVKYARETTEHFTLTVVTYILLCISVYLATVYLKVFSVYGHLKVARKVLFVIAHPDDECMFFGPVITKLAQKTDSGMYLLCLSQGDHRNKGPERRRELWASCKILGIPDSHVMICNCTNLPDDPTISWPELDVAALILQHVESLSIDTVITFDKQGVSRHLNHGSIFLAIAYLCMENKFPPNCRIYALESINILRKYSGFLDVPISYLMSSYWYILSPLERSTVRSAMMAHRSQYVWFRKLYMAFSRYTFINTLKEIEIVNLELDLELDD